MSRKQYSYDLKKVAKIPDNMPFVQLTRELLCSPSWRLMSINCHKLVGFLMVEHMNHAGLENGNLLATYDQLVKWGIPRRLIHDTITEAERWGLISVERGGRKGCVNHVSVYTLTFLVAKHVENGIPRGYQSPTNEWKKITQEQVNEIKKGLKILKQRRKKQRYEVVLSQ